jgi:hypothetical protein
MVVPLETLSGWPEVADPTALQTLAILVGFPGLAFVVIFTLGKASALISANKRQSLAVTEPVWLGRGQLDAGSVEAGSSAAELTTGPTAATVSAEVGGASARW